MTGSGSQSTLKASAVRGSFWSVIEYGGGQVLRLGGTLILSRMILPDQFALLVLVQVLLQGLQMFADFGIGPSLIRNPRGAEPDFYNTAWTIQAIRGVVIWLILCAAAVPFAHAYPKYDTDLLTTLVVVVGFTVVIGSLNSTGLPLLRRELRVKQLAFVELTSQVVQIIVMVSIALAHPSVWALVAGGYANAIVRLVLSHLVAPHPRNRFRFEAEASRSLFRFGRWILLSTMLSFFAGHADRLIFGKIMIDTELGVYSMAVTLATIVSTFVAHLAGSVVFPAVSRLLEQHDLVGQTFWKLRSPLLALGAVCTAGLVSVGPYAVELVFREQWWQAGWQVQILAAAGWITMLEWTISVVNLARGRPVILAVGHVFKILAMLVLIPLGYHLHGLPGAIVGYALTELPRYLYSMVALARAGISCWRQDVLLTLLVSATILFSMVVVEWTGAADRGRLPALLVGGLAVVLPWAPYLTQLLRSVLRP